MLPPSNSAPMCLPTHASLLCQPSRFSVRSHSSPFRLKTFTGGDAKCSFPSRGHRDPPLDTAQLLPQCAQRRADGSGLRASLGQCSRSGSGTGPYSTRGRARRGCHRRPRPPPGPVRRSPGVERAELRNASDRRLRAARCHDRRQDAGRPTSAPVVIHDRVLVLPARARRGIPVGRRAAAEDDDALRAGVSASHDDNMV